MGLNPEHTFAWTNTLSKAKSYMESVFSVTDDQKNAVIF